MMYIYISSGYICVGFEQVFVELCYQTTPIVVKGSGYQKSILLVLTLAIPQ